MTSRSSTTKTPLEQIGKFCDEWEQSTLQNACSLVTDGTHDSPKESTSGFPLVTGKCIKGGELNIGAAYLISEEDHKKVLSRSHAKRGDLLFANIGNSIGEVCQIKQEVDISIKNLALFRPSEKLDGIFLLSYLRSKWVQNYIRNSVFGSAQPFLGLGSLREFPIPIPPIYEQKAIANILGTLDEKIELNKKENKTLGDIAKVIFKSWFIDFEPVRAKAEGRSTSLPDEISDLFPDSFEDFESSLIPTGWEVVHLRDLVKNISRGISPKYTNQEKYPVINQKCIRDSQINFSLCKFTEYKKNMESKFLSNFDVLVNSMGVGTLGRVSLFMNHDKNILVDGCVTFIRGITENYSLFIFQNLLRREKEIINLSTGSTGQTSLSKESLLNMNFIKPKENLLERFSFLIKDLYIQRHNNIIQNNYLITLRDTLLPKLISGELRIPDAEKMIEDRDI